MQRTMMALRKTAKGADQIELVEVPVPAPGAGEARIQVEAAAVCATDVHLLNDRFPCTPPLTLGHEFCGRVDAIGNGVVGLLPGDRVVAMNNPRACGVCRICEFGLPNLCPSKRAMGIHSDGAFAEYIVLPASLLLKVPPTVRPEEAALCEPLAVATNTVVRRGGISAGDSVLVFGAGAIGLLCAQVARAEGCGTILLAGTNQDERTRFPCAAGLGIETVNVERDDLAGRVAGATGGMGVDLVVEASGSVSAIRDGIRLTRRGGTLAVTGITGRAEIQVPWDSMVAGALSVHFAYGSVREDWERGLSYLAPGKVRTGPLITSGFSLRQWRDAFDALASHEAIRPVFRMGG